VYKYVGMHVYMVCMCYACIFLGVYMYIHVCTHRHMYMCISITQAASEADWVGALEKIGVYLCVYMKIYTYTHVYIYTYVHSTQVRCVHSTQAAKGVYIYLCVYMKILFLNCKWPLAGYIVHRRRSACTYIYVCT